MIEILIVEDNRADVRLIEELLGATEVSYHADLVSNGEDAVRYLRREGEYHGASRPHLIILDLNLPRLSGREFLGQASELLDDIFVLIFSGSPGMGASESLPHKRMTKPFTNEEFDETIRGFTDILLKLHLMPSSTGITEFPKHGCRG